MRTHNRKNGNKLTAEYKPSRAVPFVFIVFVLLSLLFWQIFVIYQGYNFAFKVLYIIFAFIVILQMLLALLNKPFEIDQDKDEVSTESVAVAIPVYNEDKKSLSDCLGSILYQTRLPDEIHVVDDGSIDDYQNIKRKFLENARSKGVYATWHKHKKNSGKRNAHATAFSAIRNKNSIVVTIDSDGTLDPLAIAEGLKPFSGPNVQSVASIAISKTVNHSVLTRITDLIFVGFFQLIDRSSMSKLGSVIVNTGSLAFYRMDVINAALKHGYTSETFMGREVHISDDSFLTLFSLLKGRAVQQPTSIVFADMPVTISHHVRQQMRWMRGSFIRSLWRFRYLPATSYAYIRQLLGWFLLAATTTILIILLITRPIFDHVSPPLALFLIAPIIGYMQAARYFSIVRSDVSPGSQIVSFVLAPLATLYSTTVLRAFRFYGMVTPAKNGWGTRNKIEAVK